jgi:hypothetical protein
MDEKSEIHDFLLRHLKSIQNNDIETYRKTTSEDLTLYEWWITPHRLDGLRFHEFMMQENVQRGTVFGAEGSTGPQIHTCYDLANLHIQCYESTAIASYTLLISTADEMGVHVASHNESRVLVKIDDQWKVAHVHKSPTWSAPHSQPRG